MLPRTTPARQSSLALELRWQMPGQPLPVHTVQRPRGSGHPQSVNGQNGKPFDFSSQVGKLCGDICRHSPVLRHIDVSRLLFCMTQARNSQSHGLQARVTPLRFRGGELLRSRLGTIYQVQRYFVDNVEMLYLVTFCLPRFLNQHFEDKFITLFHELYHISPAFDGDLRRHEGRNAMHSHSKREYDVYMADLARAYLRNGADRGLHGFLRLNFAQLQQKYGSVVAFKVPRPRLVPIAGA